MNVKKIFYNGVIYIDAKKMILNWEVVSVIHHPSARSKYILSFDGTSMAEDVLKVGGLHGLKWELPCVRQLQVGSHVFRLCINPTKKEHMYMYNRRIAPLYGLQLIWESCITERHVDALSKIRFE